MSTDSMPAVIEIGEIRNLSKTVSDKLQELIYTGKLKPGERLVQTELAERFRVSRVAIRDALQELRQSGLAVSGGQVGGMVVRPITKQDVENIAFVRSAIEIKVALAAARNIDEKGLRKMRLIIDKQTRLRDDKDYIGFLRVDWEFHRTFYSYAHNDLALDIIEKLWTRASQARGMVLISQDWGALWSGQSIDGHREMIERIRAKDEVHLEQTLERIIEKAKREQLQWVEEVS
ncbi:MAG: GntR family transcriptional regulator [Sphaerochaeta sp.]|nr:GntR family transcriptional regulator [Sphaerochaeta sp.]